ncbi:MAG: L-serine ammonia-lyase, iron-sulfur-dependent, subunit alpha [Clostridia bacterium]|nr:L-serine ammonia-lyase, iron-sulfur-dependent, subunit alpha [Clostridia bacterium]
MSNFDSIKDLVEIADQENVKLSDIILRLQAKELGISEEQLLERMRITYHEMVLSLENAVKNDKKSLSGLTGGDANKLFEAIKTKRSVLPEFISKIIARALATGELNACMGKIVAMPTAGACGIVPAVLLTVKEENSIDEDVALQGLITAGGIGLVIANKASISGAKGGCQAECGSAASMAAAAMTKMLGGTNEMVANAAALAMKNQLGLVCDPVAGLVEVPCIKRNVGGAMIAIAAAEMSLAGIKSVIPVDEVIWAMKNVGDQMSVNLKESAKGGLAATKTGKEITENFIKSY